MEFNSKLGLGSAQFGLPYGITNKSGQTSVEEVTRILALAFNHGIRLIDRASAYGNAETILGQNILNDFKIVSKFMPSDDSSIDTQLHKSLAHLKVPSLYGYLAHRPLNVLDHPEQWEELSILKLK